MSSANSTDAINHFTDHKTTQSEEAHCFEQLHLDLDWAFGAVVTFMERDGLDSITAVKQGIQGIAGRRWNRFKEAEKYGHEKRANEMKLFAQFWYLLHKKIESIDTNGAQALSKGAL